MDRPSSVAVFGPDPLLSVTIERWGSDDDVHVHAAGQGVWLSRMAAEMGAEPTLCCFLGGETGATIRPLLAAQPGARRVVETSGSSGCYVVDRRSGERRLLAASHRPAPRRHEVDDLVSAACAVALSSSVLAVCNPFPPDGFPDDVYETLVGNVTAAGIPVVVDLSSPRLEHALKGGPDLVKVNDWELAQFVGGPVDGPRALAAAQALREAGAGAVAVTRAGAPILVVPGEGEPYEIVPPRFSHGFREGCGDTMMGATAAGLAQGMSLREALVLGAAAGAGNFLRHGLGTGTAETVRQLQRHVAVRPASPATDSRETAA
jgi:1-phosphofructokinase